MEERTRFNWFGIFSKVLFLVAFALILLWLYPKDSLRPLYDRIFNDNIQTMKDAARDYFTVDRLPSAADETVKITLRDMINAKMIIPFKDKNNNSCDEGDSYVEAKRISTSKYELTVSLTCGKESDYIVDTIGCYDLCDGDCNSSEIDVDDFDNVSTIEYEFSRAINKTEYSCDPGYVLSGSHCYKSSIADKYKANESTTEDRTETTNANISNGSTVTQYADPLVKTTYICGSEYDNAGTYDVPTTCKKKNEYTAAAKKQTVYVCSKEYVNSGTYTYPTICYKDAEVMDNPTQVIKYVCSSDYDNAGTYTSPTTCKRTISDSAIQSSVTKYVCSSAYTNAGTYDTQVSCSKRVEAAATPHTTTTDGYYTGWSCGSCNVRTFTSGQSSTNTTRFDYKGSALKYVCTSSSCPGYITVYYYVVYTRSWVNGTSTTTYTCSDDYVNKGTYSSPTTCYKYSYTPATPQVNTTYTCSDFYDNPGTYSSPTTCKKVISASSTPKTYYQCSSDYKNAGTYENPVLCIKTISQGYPATQVDSYVCSSEYDNAGSYSVPTTCKRTENITNQSLPSTSYSCPTGYNPSGSGSSTKCSKVIASPGKYYCSDANAQLVGDKCIKTIKGTSNYSCPTGYHLSGGYCYKYNNEDKPANSKCVVSKYEYKWSTEKDLTGWGRTGKYRVTLLDEDLKQPAGCKGCNCSNNITCPENKDEESCDCSK